LQSATLSEELTPGSLKQRLGFLLAVGEDQHASFPDRQLGHQERVFESWVTFPERAHGRERFRGRAEDRPIRCNSYRCQVGTETLVGKREHCPQVAQGTLYLVACHLKFGLFEKGSRLVVDLAELRGVRVAVVRHRSPPAAFRAPGGGESSGWSKGRARAQRPGRTASRPGPWPPRPVHEVGSDSRPSGGEPARRGSSDRPRDVPWGPWTPPRWLRARRARLHGPGPSPREGLRLRGETPPRTQARLGRAPASDVFAPRSRRSGTAPRRTQWRASSARRAVRPSPPPRRRRSRSWAPSSAVSFRQSPWSREP